MVSIRNVEKFVADHPELFANNKDEVLAKAKASASNGMISGEFVQGFMGVLTSRFFDEVTSSGKHLQMGIEDMVNFVGKSDIPADKKYPKDSVQCDACGGAGIKRIGNLLGGCVVCAGKGWLTPKTHPDGRKCKREACKKPLPPNHVAVYCKNKCARLDSE